MPFLILFFCYINVSFAQNNSGYSIPTSIQVKNAYTLEAVSQAKLTLQVKEYNGKYYTVGTYSSNEEGLISLSLLFNKAYTITSQKDQYYTQISIVTTTDFSRTNKNRINLSMRPKGCYRIRGLIENNSDTTINGYLEVLNSNTQEQKIVTIKDNGHYFMCGTYGETYVISPFINGTLQKKDTITLFDEDCITKRNPLLKLSLDYARPTPTVPPAKYAKGDSLVLENLVFEKKSTTLEDSTNLALEQLAKLLIENPKLIVELHIHTDARKSHRYNWILAEKRGLMIEEYLNNKGLTKDQFTTIAIGEGKELNHCKNNVRCSNAEHALNNRVEMHILQGDKDFLK